MRCEDAGSPDMEHIGATEDEAACRAARSGGTRLYFDSSSQPGSTVLRGRCISVPKARQGRSPSGWGPFLPCRAVPPGRCAPRGEGIIQAPGLHDPFPARPDDPDERLAITQNGGSRLRQLVTAYRPRCSRGRSQVSGTIGPSRSINPAISARAVVPRSAIGARFRPGPPEQRIRNHIERGWSRWQSSP